jgi:hypothetical protein
VNEEARDKGKKISKTSYITYLNLK